MNGRIVIHQGISGRWYIERQEGGISEGSDWPSRKDALREVRSLMGMIPKEKKPKAGEITAPQDTRFERLCAALRKHAWRPGSHQGPFLDCNDCAIQRIVAAFESE